MASHHLLALPAQELAELQLAAAQSPHFAYLLKKLPCFNAALANPLPDLITEVCTGAQDAARAARANTSHPEDRDELLTQVAPLQVALRSVDTAQAAALITDPAAPATRTACLCCGSTRYAHGCSRGVDQNELHIPHLDFHQEDGYLPAGLGIPGSSEGICVKVCLDCGHALNGEFPLPEDALKARVARRLA